MTMPHRPIPDEDPTSFPEPGRGADVPKQPGPAPGPKDPKDDEERRAERDDASDLLGDRTPLDPRGGGSAGAGR